MKRGPRRKRLLSLLGLALGIVAWWMAVAAAPPASPAARWADDAAWTR